MADATLSLQRVFGRSGIQQLAGPILILLVLSMMVLPLPPFLLDVFFTFNIAISVIVMLVAINVMKPLDFSVFPTVLLVTTLLRLSLNVASTRVVLLEGHTGPGAAGQVIDAFGHFLVGGNYAVGIVVFTILVIINFVVITKGAGRVAEVAARFTLDAMPGKQMAIDADLNAGLIGEDEARKRRATIADESNFFGSMDGASKFVRGDAVAGILIMFINVLGGLFVGVLQHNMDIGVAAKTYTLLRETAAAAQRQEELGLPAVLLVPGNLRPLLSRFLRRSIPQLKVLAHGEVPENRLIKLTSIIGGRS